MVTYDDRRVLRTPRPHPGAPGGLAGVASGRDAAVFPGSPGLAPWALPGRRPWPPPPRRRAVIRGEVLRDGRAALSAGRGDRPVRPDGEAAPLGSSLSPPRTPCRTGPDDQVTTEIDGLRTCREDRRDARPRHPDHGARTLLRAVQLGRPAHPGPRVLHAAGLPRGPAGPDGRRPTSSPAWTSPSVWCGHSGWCGRCGHPPTLPHHDPGG